MFAARFYRFLLVVLLSMTLLGCTHAAAQENAAQERKIDPPKAPAVAPQTVSSGDAEEAAFQRRAKFFIRQTAERSADGLLEWFSTNPYFANAGGDPHKYAMPVVIARLHLDPDDADALKLYRFLIGVDKKKGDRGLYHFATFQKTRMFFQLKDSLPREIVEFMESNVRDNFGRLVGNMNSVSYGTENHTFMSRASGFVWGEYLGGLDKNSPLNKQTKYLADWIEYQANRFYTIGMGEYDSSTYVGFSLASLANTYDFAKDERTVANARAAMDWLVVAIGRKYYFGCQLGPEARGFAKSAMGTTWQQPGFPGAKHLKYAQTGTHTDWCCWVLFGHSDRGVWMDKPMVEVNRYPALNLAMSTYRPHKVIRNIAAKNVPMPYEARGTKPTYTGDKHNHLHEVLYFTDDYAMGTLYSPDAGVRTSGTILPQTTMFKLLTRVERDVVSFGASNGYHGHFPLEGRTPYDQYHQKRGAAINITYVDKDEDVRTRHRSLLGYPIQAGDPIEKGGWFFWKSGRAWVAARPLNGNAARGQATKPGKQGQAEPVKEDTHHFLVSPGRLGGWVIQAAEGEQFETMADFQQAVLEETKLDLAKFNSQRMVSYTSLQGDRLEIRHTGGPGGRPEAWTNGQELTFENWPVYESPYVQQNVGSKVLRLSDGTDTLTIDLNGKTPLYTEGKVQQP
ncbi:MAG: hypothetical protein ACLFUJ_10870 [Phycisphaerae bacterium]